MAVLYYIHYNSVGYPDGIVTGKLKFKVFKINLKKYVYSGYILVLNNYKLYNIIKKNL